MRSPALPFLLLCLLAGPGLTAEKKGYQKLPPDASLQPLPPTTTGGIVFRGNKSFTDEQLRVPLANSIKEINAEGMSKPKADDAAYFLAVYYRKQGFPEVDVQWEIHGSQAILKIKEGAKAFLGKVTFEGNKAEPSKLLNEYMVGETEERKVKGPTPRVPFVQADVESGVARLRGFYESEGHLDAVVDEPVIHWSGDHTTADVLVKISEGPRYTFGQITFAGPSPFERAKLLDALGVVLQNGYTTQRVNTMQHNLEYFFKSQGYYKATVEVAGDPKKATPGPLNNRRVPVTFTMKVGALYHFDGVTSTGLDRLHPDFLQKRFGGLHGEVYDPAKLDEKFREVLRTGLFNNLKVNTTPLPDDTVRVDLAAEEAKAKEIGFSIGFSTYEGFIVGTRLADRDLFGSGRPLSLDLELTSRGEKGEFLYVNPWLFETENQLRARVYIQSRDEVGYSKSEEGLRLDITRKLNQHVEVGVFAQVKNVDITETSIQEQFLGTTSYQIATIGLTQSLDFRDSPTNPSKGWIFTTGLDGNAIGGKFDFGRATGRLTYFKPLFNRYLLALGARGGIILPSSDVPLDERFFNGGGTTVRSFTERTLGPRDKGNNPIGGTSYTVFNAEVEIPIKDALSGAVFFDAGNVNSQFKESQFKEPGPNDFRFAIGVGVRYKLPIGPVRLDVGFNPDPKAGEKWGAVQFSFGFAF